MKKYTCTKAFSIANKYLVLLGDKLYGEEVEYLKGCFSPSVNFTAVKGVALYNPQTREFIGNVEIEKAKECLT